MEMVVSAETIAKFFAKVIPDDNPGDSPAKKLAGKFAAQLAKTSGKDRLDDYRQADFQRYACCGSMPSRA